MKILVLLGGILTILFVIQKLFTWRGRVIASRKQQDLRNKIAWMAAFFGVYRTDAYKPDSVKEEAGKMLAFLRSFHSDEARALRIITSKVLESRELVVMQYTAPNNMALIREVAKLYATENNIITDDFRQSE